MFRTTKFLIVAVFFILIALASGDSDENLQTKEEAKEWLLDIGKFHDSTIQGYRFEFTENTVKFWVEKFDGWHSEPDDICKYTVGDKNSEGVFPITLSKCKLNSGEDFSLEDRVNNDLCITFYGGFWYRLRPGGGDQPGVDVQSCYKGWD